MKRVLAGILCSLIPTLSWAGTYVLTWPPVDGATGYVIEQSVDAGKTWAVVYNDVGTSAVIATTTKQLYLYRLSAKNASGQITRQDAGAWVDSTKPQFVGGLGIQ